MPLLNYTSTVAPEKTSAQIMEILRTHGARSIMVDIGPTGRITGIKWLSESQQHGTTSYALPVDVEATYRVMQDPRQRIPPRFQNKDQAERCAWRTVKDWIEAQMALLETQQVQMEQIFLPYMLMGDRTVYERLTAGEFKALNPGVGV